jgi:hypothetical protein
MLTVIEVKTQMAQIIAESQGEGSRTKINRLRKRMQYLNLIHAYLLEVPSVDYLFMELKRLNKRMDVLVERYKDWVPPDGLTYKQARVLYEKEMGILNIKQQIKAIKFILKK